MYFRRVCSCARLPRSSKGMNAYLCVDTTRQAQAPQLHDSTHAASYSPGRMLTLACFAGVQRGTFTVRTSISWGAASCGGKSRTVAAPTLLWLSSCKRLCQRFTPGQTSPPTLTNLCSQVCHSAFVVVLDCKNITCEPPIGFAFGKHSECISAQEPVLQTVWRMCSWMLHAHHRVSLGARKVQTGKHPL